MLRLILILPFVFAASEPAAGQGSDDLYHGAARAYVQGETSRAEALAVRGLEVEPGHIRLQQLLELIQARPDPSAGGAGEQSEDAPEGAPPEQPDPAGQPPASGEPGEGEDGEPDDGEPQESDPDAEAASGDEGADQGAEGQPMSVDDAERILRAIEADERETLRQAQRRRSPTRPADKDW
jgi:hypothetical protein